MKNISYPSEFINMYKLKPTDKTLSLFGHDYSLVGRNKISKANHKHLILKQNAKQIKEYLIGFIVIRLLDGSTVKQAIEDFYKHTNISEDSYSEESLLQLWNRYVSQMRKTYNMPFQKKS